MPNAFLSRTLYAAYVVERFGEALRASAAKMRVVRSDAVAIDADAVTVLDGTRIPAEHVILATGLAPRMAPSALPPDPRIIDAWDECALAALPRLKLTATDQFNKESVLFRESERWGVGLWVKHLLRDRESTPSFAEAMFCGVLILMIRFFISFAMPVPHTFRDFAVLAGVTQLVVVATPALLMTAS